MYLPRKGGRGGMKPEAKARKVNGVWRYRVNPCYCDGLHNPHVHTFVLDSKPRKVKR